VRPELPAILDSVANDFDASGSQYATLAALIREAAHELALAHTPPAPKSDVGGSHLVFDPDGVPLVGRVCHNCEEF
jgi:hypothetical protein